MPLDLPREFDDNSFHECFLSVGSADVKSSNISYWKHSFYNGLKIAQFYLGDETATEAAIGKLIADFSGNDDIGEAIGDIVKLYIELGDDQNAEAAIDKLIADFNGHPDLSSAISSIETGYYMRIAADYSLREDFLHAVKVWEKVKTKFPDFFHDDPDLYYFIGDCYRHLGEYEKAIQHYGIAAANWTVNGYAVVPHVVVPLPSESSGDYIAFHVLIDSLIADFGEDPGLAATILRTGYEYRRRANDARREGLSSEAEVDNFKAIALYDRVINEFGSSAFVASAYFFSALSFRDLGRWQDALDCCNRLLDNWPDYKYASWARKLAQNCSERLAEQVQ